MELLPSFWPHRAIALGAFVWFGKRGSLTRRPLLPLNAGTAEPVRVSPPEAVSYLLELRYSLNPTEVPMSQLIAMFCDIDDFCKWFEPLYLQRLLQSSQHQRVRQGHLTLSEIMTIIVYFHSSHY